MKKSIMPLIAVLLGAFLFNVLFWNEKQGLNTLIFDIFIVATLWQLDKEPFLAPSVKITVGGTLLTSLLIVWHNSLLAIFIHNLSFIIMIGMIQQRELRFLGLAMLQYFLNWFTVPVRLVQQLTSIPLLRRENNLLKRINGIWLTLLILPVFYLIYFVANAKFAELATQFWQQVFPFLTFDIDMERVLFFVLGVFIVGATVWQHHWINLSEKEAFFKETLSPPENLKTDSVMYRNALNLIIMLNILLFINNFIDVRYVWFGDVSGKTALELKQYVHEGTYLLIYGILLAIIVILWLFRDSLNFVDEGRKKPLLLRGATTVWLVQNAILALSVGIRNGQYINHYGLAYKRIGVFIFLILTLYGLWLLYVKIKEKRTFYSFICRGSYAIYVVLVAICLVNWDVFITKFNINVPTKSNAIDVRFLVKDVSDKNLYLLFSNTERLAAKMPAQPFPDSDYGREPNVFANDDARLVYLKSILNNKKTAFEVEQKTYSWLSWNYSDYVNQQFFK